jgi:hypothetical protein
MIMIFTVENEEIVSVEKVKENSKIIQMKTYSITTKGNRSFTGTSISLRMIIGRCTFS